MYSTAVARTLKSKRFWVWQICGAIIYAIPAAIRLATGDVNIPVLSLLSNPWVGHWIPGNLAEKILVNAFFPGGAGAVAGEILYLNLKGTFSRRQKYLARLAGAMLWTTAWSIFQFWGNSQSIIGSYGGNIFEFPYVFPLNFSLGALSIFTPDVLGFLKAKFAVAYSRLRGFNKG
jgi:hypothetical protein